LKCDFSVGFECVKSLFARKEEQGRRKEKKTTKSTYREFEECQTPKEDIVEELN
jgi:hypothetical protein